MGVRGAAMFFARQIKTIAIAAGCALLCVSSVTSAAPPKPEDVTISEDARRHFAAGIALLQDPDGSRWEEAYLAFKAAYSASPSPKILGNVGLCAMKLERDGEAIEAYTRYIREVADIDAEERAQITRDLQTLSVTVVRLTLTVSPEVEGITIVDHRMPVRGERLSNMYNLTAASPATKGAKLEIGIRPGRHEIVARAPGYDDAVWEFEAYGGTRESHAMTLQQKLVVAPVAATLAASGRSSSFLPWLTTGTGVAMMGVGAVTGIVALGKVSDLEKRCPNDTCPSNSGLEADRSSARSMIRATDILLIGGGLVTGAGITWLVLQSRSSTKSEASRIAAGGLCTSQGCMGSLGASF